MVEPKEHTLNDEGLPGLDEIAQGEAVWAAAPSGDVLGELGLDARTAPLSLLGPSVYGPASWLVFSSAQAWADHIAGDLG